MPTHCGSQGLILSLDLGFTPGSLQGHVGFWIQVNTAEERTKLIL